MVRRVVRKWYLDTDHQLKKWMRIPDVYSDDLLSSRTSSCSYAPSTLACTCHTMHSHQLLEHTRQVKASRRLDVTLDVRRTSVCRGEWLKPAFSSRRPRAFLGLFRVKDQCIVPLGDTLSRHCSVRGISSMNTSDFRRFMRDQSGTSRPLYVKPMHGTCVRIPRDRFTFSMKEKSMHISIEGSSNVMRDQLHIDADTPVLFFVAGIGEKLIDMLPTPFSSTYAATDEACGPRILAASLEDWLNMEECGSEKGCDAWPAWGPPDPSSLWQQRFLSFPYDTHNGHAKRTNDNEETSVCPPPALHMMRDVRCVAGEDGRLRVTCGGGMRMRGYVTSRSEPSPCGMALTLHVPACHKLVRLLASGFARGCSVVVRNNGAEAWLHGMSPIPSTDDDVCGRYGSVVSLWVMGSLPPDVDILDMEMTVTMHEWDLSPTLQHALGVKESIRLRTPILPCHGDTTCWVAPRIASLPPLGTMVITLVARDDHGNTLSGVQTCDLNPNTIDPQRVHASFHPKHMESRKGVLNAFGVASDGSHRVALYVSPFHGISTRVRGWVHSLLPST